MMKTNKLSMMQGYTIAAIVLAPLVFVMWAASEVLDIEFTDVVKVVFGFYVAGIILYAAGTTLAYHAVGKNWIANAYYQYLVDKTFPPPRGEYDYFYYLDSVANNSDLNCDIRVKAAILMTQINTVRLEKCFAKALQRYSVHTITA